MPLQHRNNWNAIRLLLATIVLLGHLGPARFITSFIQDDLGLHFLHEQFAVLLFFITSGFLITGSFLANQDLTAYAKRRLLRIYPPVVIVAIIMFSAALILGNYSFKSLFSISHLLVFQDLTSMMEIREHVYYHGAFWTLVVEVQFYIILPIFIHLYLKKPKWAYCIMVIMYLISIYASEKILGLYAGENHVYAVTFRQSFFAYAAYFWTGALFKIHFKHLFTDRRIYIPLFIIALFFFISHHYPHTSMLGGDVNRILYPLSLGVLLIGLALFIPAIKWPFPDISYGMYIYHFPIFGIVASFGIGNIKSDFVQTGINFSACVVVSLLSYYLVEKKCIQYGRVKRPNPLTTSL